MNSRNHGIDLLRIVSMYMIVILHVLGKGGILDYVTPLSNHYWAAWFLEILSYCAVNCFALISGYVMWNRSFELRRVISLWLHIAFYTILITCIMFTLYPETRCMKNIVNALFPVSTHQYWYVSAYFGLLLLMPMLNMGIQSLSKNILEKQLFLILMMVTVFANIFACDAFNMRAGYSAIWLIILYLVGGYLSKYSIAQKIKCRYSFLMFFSCAILTFIVKLVMENITNTWFGMPQFGNILISYTSPSIVFAGIFLFLGFARLRVSPSASKIITAFSPAAFGVYLIHVHPLVFNKLIHEFSIGFLEASCPVMVIKVFLSSILIFTVCILIEWMRLRIMDLLRKTVIHLQKTKASKVTI